MKRFIRMGIAAALFAATACDNKPASETAPPAKPRWQYTGEDFGIGKPHTKNRACNRDIDQLLDQIRECYNARAAAECEALQTQNSTKIGRLKNARRCAR